MSGFPARPPRSAFGPTYEETAPVRNPKTQLSAAVVNLFMWQLAGLGLTTPRGKIRATVAGAAVTNVEQKFSFDPAGALVPVTIAYVGAGHYRLTLAATYPDESGTSVSFTCEGAKVVLDSDLNLNANVKRTGSQLDIYVFTANTAAATDPAGFLLLIY